MATIFSDGFESGDFSAWTGKVGSGAIVTGGHCGSYAYEASGSYGAESFIYREFLPSTKMNYRAYVKTEGSIPQDRVARIFNINREGGWQPQFTLRFQGATYSSGYAVQIQTTNGDSSYYTFDWSNGWNCYEMSIDITDYTDITTVLYVNGVSAITVTNGISGQTEENSHMGRFSVGQIWDYHTNVDVYVDCVVVSDSYIGPETSGPRFYGDGLSWVVLR